MILILTIILIYTFTFYLIDLFLFFFFRIYSKKFFIIILTFDSLPWPLYTTDFVRRSDWSKRIFLINLYWRRFKFGVKTLTVNTSTLYYGHGVIIIFLHFYAPRLTEAHIGNFFYYLNIKYCKTEYPRAKAKAKA